MFRCLETHMNRRVRRLNLRLRMNLLALPRKVKMALVASIDVVAIATALLIAITLRSGSLQWPTDLGSIWYWLIIPPASIPIFMACGLVPTSHPDTWGPALPCKSSWVLSPSRPSFP